MTDTDGRDAAVRPSRPSVTNLHTLASRLSYKPGWTFKVGGPGGTRLCVFARTPDSMDPTRQRVTQHMFEPPDGCTDLVRWAFDCLLLVEQHETGEFFQIGGDRPFFPNHQDEGSPYVIVDRRQT